MDSAGRGRLVAGRYRLIMVIGRGGMGVVWRARDELLDRDVAVKEIIWPAYLTEEEKQAACRRASREAQMAARLNHRNVIRVFDIVEEDGCPWIVMELLPHRSLRDLVQDEGPLTPDQAARVGLGILAALRAAHAEDIIHRDVKPANILIGPDDRVVLTDFGIACAADNPTITTASVLIGSPSYIAPERARGRHSGPAADLWGLGASLYAAVEGRPPFDRDGALASLTAVIIDELDPAEHAGPLWPVISGLLRKDPAERLDAAETERMLDDVLLNPVSGEPRRSRRPVGALAGSAALAVLAVSAVTAGVVLTGSPGHQAEPAAAIGRPPATSARTPAASANPAAITAPRPAATKNTPAASTRHTTAPHLTARTAPTRPPRPSPARPSARNTGSMRELISQVVAYIQGLERHGRAGHRPAGQHGGRGHGRPGFLP
jgi:eukaryotic-like serine/threonine-protein kinase